MEKRVVVRIVGFASTAKGFGFAVTEGSRRLVKWNVRRVPVSRASMVDAISVVLRQTRPLFVAFEEERSHRQRRRGKTLALAIQQSCAANGVMVLPIRSRNLLGLSENERPTKWHIAKAVSGLFPRLAGRVPPRRLAWSAEDERIGLFMALAAAVCAWEGFRSGKT